MTIQEYMAREGGYTTSARVKGASLYRELLNVAATGEIVRVRQGLYATQEALSRQMVDVETIVPGGVLCLFSAWSYHNLTTQIPQAYNIAVQRNRKVVVPSFPPVELVYMSTKSYSLGIEEVAVDGYRVKVYNLEKSVCDAIKYRNKIGIDVSAEIFKNYLARADRDISRLYEYASQLRVKNYIDQLIKYMI